MAVGGLSPSYMYLEQIPAWIHDWNPEVKLIFILRNPIERAYLDYWMNLDHGVFSRAVDQGMQSDKRI